MNQNQVENPGMERVGQSQSLVEKSPLSLEQEGCSNGQLFMCLVRVRHGAVGGILLSKLDTVNLDFDES